jgi:hypothetical protein
LTHRFAGAMLAPLIGEGRTTRELSLPTLCRNIRS